MKREEVINRDPEIFSGEPVFAGTRIPVKFFIGHLIEGDSIDDFLDGFPSVSREQAVSLLEMALEALTGETNARAA